MNSDTTTTFTEEEKTALRLYCRTCDEILASRFVKDLPKQDHSIRSWKLPDGTWDSYVPVYDRDDFRSFMAVFRKLLLKKEPTNMYKILNILSRRASEEERVALKEIEKNFQSMEEHHFAFNLGTEEKRDLYSPRAVCEVILNADLFHSDPEKQNALEKLKSFGSIYQVFLLKFVTDFCQQAVQISATVKHRGYFD